ncbi:hypothetical protein FB446DRAFT_654692, partial [Lentinula raphanica]
MKVILILLRALTRTLTRRTRPPIRTALGQDIAEQIPKDIHTVIDHYALNPSCRTFISCPECHALYPLTDNSISANEDAYSANRPLSSCTNKSHPDSSPCGTTLWRTRSIGPRTFIVPVQKQIFQNLREWIGRLLAIPGIEDILTKYSSNPASSVNVRDFCESRIFKEFLGKDNQPFMQVPAN